MQDIEEIYKNYAKTVYKYIFCLCKNETLSEDIMQETFLVASENIDKYRGESKISTWLCSIAKFIWYKRIKKDKQINKIPFEENDNFIFIEDVLDENLLKKEEKIWMYKKINSLDEETKNIMYLRILGDLTYEEISEIVGKSINYVRVKFFRGKEKIIKEKKEDE